MKLDGDVRIPKGAEERAWHVVRSAYEDRIPAPRERRVLGPAVVLAVLLAVGASAVSPPGRAVLDSIRETVGVEKAAPALFSLPAPGRLLVESDAGPWVVQADGSKRRLGAWRDASWSPFGRFVVVARRNELATMEPNGDVHWKLARPNVRFPRWGGTRVDTRIAYLSGRELRAVGGDGKGDRRVARRSAAIPPAWRPGPAHVLAYASQGLIHVVDADRGTVLMRKPIVGEPVALEWVADRLLVLTKTTLTLYDDSGGRRLVRRGRFVAAALAPRAQAVATVRTDGATSAVDVTTRSGATHRVFAGAGRFRSVTWSPDGRWLLVSWRDADQWVVLRVRGGRRLKAFSNVSGQFESSAFPRVAGWVAGS